MIAAYVAERTGQPQTALLPGLAGQVSLGLAVAGYEVWLAEPAGDLSELLDRSMATLHDYFVESYSGGR